MSGRPTGWRRFLRLWRPNTEADIDAELRFHFEQKIADLVARGAAPDVARAQAVAEFGNVAAVRSSLREIDGRIAKHRQHAEWWESIAQDLGYVLRSLRRSPGFTVMVAVTLALGLGANAALFSILDRMFLQAPPGVADPGQLRRVFHGYHDSRGVQQILSNFSPPEFRAIAAALPAGTQVAGFGTQAKVHLGRDDSAPQGVVIYVLGDYFGTLGVRLAAGRPFDASEWRAEAFAPVAVISYDLAHDRFLTAQNAVGKTFEIGSHQYTVIGIAPKPFRGTDLDAGDVWVPMNTRGTWANRDMQWYERHGTLFIRALLRAHDIRTFPAIRVTTTVALRKAAEIRDTLAFATFGSIKEAVAPGFNVSEQAIATRLGAVALAILLIACANVANLLLARALQRRREIGVRLALGVSRSRLVRQLLTESLVLATISGLAALLVAAWTATALRQALLPNVQWGAPAIGLHAVTFAAATAVLAGFAAGLVLALHASRPDVTGVLRGGARDGGLPRSRVRTTLLVSQLALSCVLLTGAGLFVRSLQRVETVDIGYDAAQIVFAGLRTDPELGRSRDAELDVLLKEAAQRIERFPGVEHVAFTENVPMSAFSFVSNFLPERDSVPTLDGSGPIVSFVSPGFFATMGMRVLVGRDFSPNDRTGSEPVLLVNSIMARTLWPGESAIGKCLILHKREDPCRRIIGVVSNSHYGRLIERPSMQFYVPLAQEGDDGKLGTVGALEIRAAIGRVTDVGTQVRRLLVGLGGTGSTPWIRTLAEQLSPELRTWRLGAALFSAAGLLALLVAAVGVYSTLAYTVSQRTHEMGVRVALGARETHILRLVVGEGVRVVAVGVAAGAVIALALGRLVASMLYDTSPHDPAVLVASAVVLLGVAVVACLVPAWRATRADPMTALRAE
ncbi:MAG TPA: ADOP family duplicated permease [Gemmatimonadaceae bacterium]|nr:ADOP family duplicated permease [Gemmatimonadaceae bacterium]